MKYNTLLSRRTFLRGCVAGSTIALGLPPLEAMLTNNGAYANGAFEAKPIFGLFFWANGLPWHRGNLKSEVVDFPDLWTPSKVGAGFDYKELMEPLARHQVNVATGLTPTTEVPRTQDGFPGGQSDGHMRGFMVALTGDRPEERSFDHPSHKLTALRPSIDQYVAKHADFYGSEEPLYRSMQLGVSKARFHNYGHWNAISYNGPNSLNTAVSSPSQLYNSLFNVAQNTQAQQKKVQDQTKMLDAILEDAKNLKKRLGARDRVRLDEHLDHISTIQTRLTASAALQCTNPEAPTIDTPRSGSLHPATEVMADLLAAALRCDMTRVFSFMLTSPATTHVFNNLGVSSNMHSACHQGQWENVRKITRHQMEAFSLMLDALKGQPDPVSGKTLFDRACVLATSEYGEGWKHRVHELPVLMAGGANGRLAANTHARVGGGSFAEQSLSRAHLTALQAVGLPETRFGWNRGDTDKPLTSLLKG